MSHTLWENYGGIWKQQLGTKVSILKLQLETKSEWLFFTAEMALPQSHGLEYGSWTANLHSLCVPCIRQKQLLHLLAPSWHDSFRPELSGRNGPEQAENGHF